MAAAIDVSALDRWVTQARSRRGAALCIRPLRPDDREREVAFINSLSPRSRYFRLFTPLNFLPRHLIDQLMDIDYRRRMAFVATTQQGEVEQFVGVARYAETDEAGTAELGVSVADAWQRCGIASLLLGQLIRYAREQNIQRLTGLVLPDNQAMIALARRLEFTVSYDPAQHLFRMSRDLRAPETSQVAAESGFPAESQVHLDQVSDRARAHLLHDVRAVNLDGSFAQAEVDRDDFVRLAVDHVPHHFALARRQGLGALPEIRETVDALADSGRPA